MKFIILAYNPNYINPNDLVRLIELIRSEQECPVYTVQHINRDAEPIYCVQLADTEYK